jgi:GTP-binding protein
MDEMLRLTECTLASLPPITVYEPEVSPEETAAGVAVGERETVIRKEGEVYFVEGEWIYNLMGQINFGDYESMNFFQRVLKKQGVFDKLREAGINDGDTVNMYDFEFEFVY